MEPPLCFRRLLEGAWNSEGDACRDKLRPERDPEVPETPF